MECLKSQYPYVNYAIWFFFKKRRNIIGGKLEEQRGTYAGYKNEEWGVKRLISTRSEESEASQ